MGMYRVTCEECGDWAHGWTRKEAEENFRVHVRLEHAVSASPDSGSDQ